MGHLRLLGALHAFAEQATLTLAGALAAGEEIDFEVEPAGPRGGPALDRYRPLTREFIAGHWPTLRELPSAPAAAASIASLERLEAYVERHEHQLPGGGARELPDAALRCFTCRLFGDGAEQFELDEERFAEACRELEAGSAPEHGGFALLARLGGITAGSPEVELGDGLVLAPAGRLDALPPDPSWLSEDGRSLVVAIACEDGADGLRKGLARLRDLQSALRLYAAGVSLSPLAWIHRDGAAWRPLPLPAGGRCDGAVTLAAEREEELRAFCGLFVRRRPIDGELAWALARFELGCDRDDPLIGLTDHLLALRALLEPEGPRSGRLAGRIAALCALPEDRTAMTERVARAISLEASLIAGVTPHADADALARELEDALRALLRDVLCGYLEPDLVGLADEHIYVPEPSGEPRLTRGAIEQPEQAPLEQDAWSEDGLQGEVPQL